MMEDPSESDPPLSDESVAMEDALVALKSPRTDAILAMQCNAAETVLFAPLATKIT